MAWFKVDELALDDWRIRALAEQLAITHGDAFLLCCRVWNHVNKRGAGVVSRTQVDRVVGEPGFADALVENELADALEDGTIRIRGDERATLNRVSEAQSAKAKLRWKRERERRAQLDAITGTEPSDASGSEPDPKPDPMPGHCRGIAAASGPASVRHMPGNADLDRDQDRDPESLAVPSGFALRESNSLSGEAPDAVAPRSSESAERQQSIAGIPAAPSAAVRANAIARTEAADWLKWFNADFDRRFRVNDQLIADVRKLLRSGFTQRDMRKVAVFKSEQWTDPKMREHLNPRTLLRPSRFASYLDEARSLLFRDEDDPTNGSPNGKAH